LKTYEPFEYQFYSLVPPDLCLLGCIFVICDYAKDPEESILSSNWKKVIRHYGGEVEETYQARITHVLCKNQDSPFAVQVMNDLHENLS